MAASKIKKNDVVVVISGADKGRRGRVLRMIRDKARVVVEGVNVRKKTMRRSQAHPQGGINELPCPIHISNVMPETRYDGGRRARTKTETAGAAAADNRETQGEVQDK